MNNTTFQILKSVLDGNALKVAQANTAYEVLNAVYDSSNEALRVNITNLPPDDGSKWEDDGETQIIPKDGKHIDASIIDNLPSGDSYWELDGSEIASYASYEDANITLTADNPGEIGNEISITGEYTPGPFMWTGIPTGCTSAVTVVEDVPNQYTGPIVFSVFDTLATSISNHNILKPENTVSILSGDDTQIPSEQDEVTLDGIPKQIGILVAEWNANNESNTVTLGSDPFYELGIGVNITLSGGTSIGTQIQPKDGKHIDASIIDNLPSGDSYWELDGSEIASYANYIGTDGLDTEITLTADNAGEAGNDIQITGAYETGIMSYTGIIPGTTTQVTIESVEAQNDGISVLMKKDLSGYSIAENITIYNNANPDYQIVLTDGDDTQVITSNNFIHLIGTEKSLSTLISEWNSDNTENTVTITGDDTQLLEYSIQIKLSGGQDAAVDIRPKDGYKVNFYSIRNNIKLIEENYQVQDEDYVLIVGSGVDTILIPTFLCVDGKIITIKCSINSIRDAETLNVSISTEAETIDGSSDALIVTENNNSYTLIALKGAWFII